MGSVFLKFQRRHVVASALTLLVTSMLVALPTVAQDYPSQNITYVVAAGVGGGSDILARTLAKVLDEKDLLPVQVLVENRTGGSGAIGYTYLDGQSGNPHYLGGVGVSFFTTPLLGKMPISFKDFTPLAAIARSPYIFAVRADSPVQTLEDLKTTEGLTIGSVGAVADPSLLAHLTNKELGTSIKVVPYDGEGEVLAAILGGHLDLLYGNPNEILEQVNVGTLRPIAVTSTERMTSLPNVPTFKELGYNISHTQLRGIIMPGDVSPEAVVYWEGVLKQVAESPEWKAQYIDRFNEVPIFLNSEEFAAQMVETSALYETMMKDLGLIQ